MLALICTAYSQVMFALNERLNRVRINMRQTSFWPLVSHHAQFCGRFTIPRDNSETSLHKKTYASMGPCAPLSQSLRFKHLRSLTPLVPQKVSDIRDSERHPLEDWPRRPPVRGSDAGVRQASVLFGLSRHYFPAGAPECGRKFLLHFPALLIRPVLAGFHLATRGVRAARRCCQCGTKRLIDGLR